MRAVMNSTPWLWPLPMRVPVPAPGHPGAFGAVRRHDVHTGVDLYCKEGTRVLAVEDGEVKFVIPFTGPRASSPWWHETYAIGVEGASGVVVYGEVFPCGQAGMMSPGMAIKRGDSPGYVMRVLKGDKGRPTSMLHLELYVPWVENVIWWYAGDKPLPLLDPTLHLLRAERIIK